MQGRDWFRVHSFTGVITGMLLFVICFSGTFAVVAHELDWLVIPQARVVPKDQTSSWGEITSAAAAVMPEAKVFSVRAPLHAYSAARVSMRPPGETLHFVWVDPYTAEVTGTLPGRYTVQRFFRDFHREFFIPRAGLYFVSLFGVTMLVSVTAALFFYRRWWRRFFRFKLRPGRVFWSELHKTMGLWSLWFAAVIALTSVWYLFEAGRYDFGDGIANYLGSGDAAVQRVREPAGETDATRLAIDELVARVAEQWPQLGVRRIYAGYPLEDSFTVRGQSGFPLVRDAANSVVLDGRTGALLGSQRAGELPAYWVWSHMADPLHFGDFAGLWSKAIWFVFGLALCGLILTGTYLHSHRLIREAGGRARHRWSGTWAAIGVSLLVLVASIPLGLEHARRYSTGDSIAVQPPGVGVVILGWVVLTLAIIAWWLWLLWRPYRMQSARSA